ncbi:MAG TPA: tRNA 4-thiouridine(8) synthase ThiI, partial [Candidatus Moranbacteria bacterium]|nr:tRNA 4-thiouridine(8) synthase ThiI [Candidatus Moranbacteria bacterium]
KNKKTKRGNSDNKKNNQLDVVRQELKEIFGIANFSFTKEVLQDIEVLKKECWKMVKDNFLAEKKPAFNKKTFRVTTQRSNKNFPMTSEEINREVGGYIFEKLKNKGLNPKVSLKNPDIECFIEIVNKTAFIFAEKIKGLNGMPVGTGGRALAMLSGGIDSPVAGYYGLKRGVNIDFIHFHSLPYTSVASNEKVEALAKKLLKFQMQAKIFMVPFAKIQQEIVIKCPEKLRVIMYRRLMLKIAEKIAEEKKYLALYSGESVAQVASQTLENILATNDAVSMTILRPLSGFDKEEIIEIAKKIDTYDISILPHEDCCTRFVPKHPETRAKLEDVRNAEKKLDLKKVINEAIAEMEVIKIN